MPSQNTAGIKTYTIAAGVTAYSGDGCMSVDIINTGTKTAYITGAVFGSTPAPIPAGYTYTVEFGNFGYSPILIDNTGNDGDLGIVEKY